MNTRCLLLSFLFLASAPWVGLSQVSFTKITEVAIVNDWGNFTGHAWGDYDGDGWLDLFVSNYEDTMNVLYRNDGAGTFTKITGGNPVADSGYHAGAAWGDFDNDGLLDLIVAAPGLGSPEVGSSSLYRQTSKATFSLMDGNVLTNETGRFIAPAWVDYDNDGWLDLFLTNPSRKNRLYHNNADGTFVKVTSGQIVEDLGRSVAAAWADYDNDGYPDLFVANDSIGNPCFLYHNERNGTFTRVTTGPVATDRSISITAAWGDFDNNGFLDLFVTGDTNPKNRLYRNNGDGSFTKITSGPELDNPVGTAAEGAVWGDYDNDGHLDLFISYYGGQNALFHNTGDGTFEQVQSGSVVDETAGPNFTCSWADYDNDGFLDLFVARLADLPEPNLLYHNDRNNHHWLEVRCIGTVSNRSAIGAKVRAKSVIGGVPVWQLREINGGDGGASAASLVAHFGLAETTRVETLRIEWPSGAVQEFQNVSADQSLTMVEPPRLQALGRSPGGFRIELVGAVGFSYSVETSEDLLAWLPWTTVTNSSRTMTLFDRREGTSTAYYYRAVGRD
ncbi:MAG TPA: CRTAC1 family protein [Verrucomicrobiota bacterium]|nr:hypothetical protein [Verrucomicrobiales bacterium]HRI14984.1 CRTAC1 family protein [Verrucomicrobiota bacterium]